jgi:hypothetical protein
MNEKLSYYKVHYNYIGLTDQARIQAQSRINRDRQINCKVQYSYFNLTEYLAYKNQKEKHMGNYPYKIIELNYAEREEKLMLILLKEKQMKISLPNNMNVGDPIYINDEPYVPQHEQKMLLNMSEQEIKAILEVVNIEKVIKLCKCCHGILYHKVRK